MVFAESLVITYLVPLVTLEGSKDRKIIIGTENLKRAHAKEILRPLESLKILCENAQPGIHQVQNPKICTRQTRQTHQVTVPLMWH